MIKYGYSSFKLDILEYCDPTVLIVREQFYLDQFKPEFIILKIAGSLKGFRHSEATIEVMRAAKLGRNRTDAAKLKIAAGSAQAQPVIVTDNKTGENI